MSVFSMIAVNATKLMNESIKLLRKKPSKHTKTIQHTDILTYLAMRLSLTWKEAKTTIRKKYQNSKEDWWIGFNRFSVIAKYAIADLYKLRDTLNTNFLHAVSPSSYFCIDEALFAFEGNSPVLRYMPRKPHKTGHLSYLVGFKMNRSNLPFILGMHPVLPKVDVREMAKIVLLLVDMIRSVHNVDGSHVIFDAAFTSADLAKELLKRGVRCTGSISSKKAPKWWPVIERNLPVLGGRTLSDKDGIMWNVYREDETTIHSAMSTSFRIDETANMQQQWSTLHSMLLKVQLLLQQKKKQQLQQEQQRLYQQQQIQLQRITTATRFRFVKPQIEGRQLIYKQLMNNKKLINRIKQKDLKKALTSSNEECLQLVRPKKVAELVGIYSIIERVRSSKSSSPQKSTTPVKLIRRPSSLKYRVKWVDGKVSVVMANQFVKNDRLNYHFIVFARKDDYLDFFNSATIDELKKYCQAIGKSQSE